MVIVKVNGDLTIDSGVTVGPYYTEYGGPKGFTLYVTGTLTNNGTIDNSHGAKAVGQNVYLWKNADETYEYVPAVGGAGVSGSISTGTTGTAGSGRQTGGGASGAGKTDYRSGAGSPGGINSVGEKGSNGTGGLLIIYANNYINNGAISAYGYSGGGSNRGGGASGGGSINVFYTSTVIKGTINVNGGVALGNMTKSVAGGKGTVTYYQITD